MKIAYRHVPFAPEQMDELKRIAAAHGAAMVACSPDASIDASEFADCEVLLGYFPPALFKAVPHLKWVQTPAAGVDRLCGDIYPSKDVILTNCSGAFGVAISEYLMTGLLMLLRHMPSYLRNQQDHVWRCEGRARSIYGSTVTVVGLGDLGSNFARRMKAMGAYVRGVRRTAGAKPDYVDELFESNALAEAVKGADVVAVCLPGTPATEGMVSRQVIEAMGQETILLNAGRGRTLDEAALIQALSQGKLGGAVLDVVAVEPLPQDSALWDMENVIVTPHISGRDDDAVNVQTIFQIFRDNLVRYLDGQPLMHVVDRKLGY